MQPKVKAWRWALAGPLPGPLLTEALRLGEAVRACLMATARLRTGSPLLPVALHGDERHPDPAHGHAHYRSEDLDGDGRIDHLLVHAPGGLDGESLGLLAAAGPVWLASGRWDLVPLWMGEGPAEPCHGAGRAWHSVTPYVAPWHPRRNGNFDVARQVARECGHRGLPPPQVGEAPEMVFSAEAFALHRRERARPATSRPVFLRLLFPEPVPGPLALGYGAHFGLGAFVRDET